MRMYKTSNWKVETQINAIIYFWTVSILDFFMSITIHCQWNGTVGDSSSNYISSGEVAAKITDDHFSSTFVKFYIRFISTGSLPIINQHWFRECFFTCIVPNQYLKPWPTCVDTNTLRPKQNDCHFAADIFKCILLNENVCVLIQI